MKPLNSAVVVALAVLCFGAMKTTLVTAQDETVPRAKFTDDGSVVLPTGYRKWFHVGTRYKPIGLNILDNKVTETPEIFNAYVEPGAMAVFEQTGKWPVGTQIVKEFSTVKVGQGCDPATMLCTTQLGSGIYEEGFIGLGYMVKDPQRFPQSPGGWGYFSFGHQPPPYEATARFNQNCVGCHVNLAAKTDYVIVQAHIGLMSGSH